MKKPELSVVIPFLDEEASLPILLRALDAAGLPDDRELVLVSDGSTDGSIALVEAAAAKDPRVKLLVLTRNFGHQAAITAGLDAASGRWVAVMDADGQDPPEVLAAMLREAKEGAWDVVFHVRASRAGGPLKRLAYGLFYRLYGWVAESPVDRDSGDFCVLTRRAVDTLARLPERVRFVRGLRSWAGLRSKPHSAARPERSAGAAQYTWGRLFDLAVNGLLSFSSRPLRLATAAGLFLCVASMLLAAAYLAAWFLYDIHAQAPGFTTIVLLLLFLSGCQFLLLGILGEYVGQIFREVKGRPPYLVARAVNLDERA